jgi:non-ribosomal peptide synthetase component F
MMAENLLNLCWKKGIKLTANGMNLTFTAPEGVMNESIIEQIKAHKPALLTMLQQQPDYFEVRPLSANEQSLWFMYRLDPNSVAYNMAYAIELKNHYSDDAIKAVFSQLVQAHPNLCRNYIECQGEREGQPGQSLETSPAPALEISENQQADAQKIKQWISEQADRPLAPDNNKTCHGAFLRSSKCYLVIVVHHIAADFISFEHLRNDLLNLLDGKRPNDKDPKWDYSQWTYRQYNEINSADAAYWLNSLKQTPQLQLPTDFTHKSEHQSAGAEIQQTLPLTLSAHIRQSCRDNNVTPYVWWMASFMWFMSRMSGQDDFVIGTPSAGRLTPQDNELVGYLVNPIALRCQIDNKQAFTGWLAKVNEQVKQMIKHQAYPFSTLLEKLNVTREAGRSPLFQHMFTLNHLHTNALADELVEQELLAEQRGAAHELNLVVVDDKTHFTCKWRYNNSLYKPATVEGIQARFNHFVEQLLQDQQRCPAQLLAGPESMASRLSGQSLTPVAPTAWQAFQNSVKAFPQAIAISHNGEKISYADLNERIEQQAKTLRKQGFNAGDRLPIHQPRGVEQVVLMLASWRLKGAFVVLDANWPQARIDEIVKDIQAANNVQFDAYVVYTSGSTGKPKAVSITQSNLVHYVSAVMQPLALTANASMAGLAAHSADLGYTALFGALLTGRCLRILDETLALDSLELIKQLKAEPVDCLKIVPSHLNGILQAENDWAVLPKQALICGGEAFSPQLYNTIAAQAPELNIFNHYGPSETTIGVLIHQITQSKVDDIPLGLPMNNVDIRVVDRFGHDQVQGLQGELYIGGPTVSPGCLKVNSLKPDIKWYRTGDTVVMKDQKIHYIGRNDSQIKIRGYRVELGEIENCIKQKLSDAVVLNLPDENGKNQLIAYLVASSQQLIQVQQHIEQALPAHMQPSQWNVLDSLPRLANGKVDKLSLKQIKPKQQETIIPQTALSKTETELSETEKTLLSIWQQVLGKNDITVTDNFFAIGGDSIIGLQIIAKARAHNIILMPKDIFAHKTVAALSQVQAQIQAQMQAKSAPVPKPTAKPIKTTIDDQAFASLLSELET